MAAEALCGYMRSSSVSFPQTARSAEQVPWGPGVTKMESLVGLPLGAIDVTWAAGKRRAPGAAEGAGSVGRTKIQTLQGLPLQGMGADISLAGGKRRPSPEPVGSVGRTRIEAMSGMPMSGQGADIALFTGRRQYSTAEKRGCSAPPVMNCTLSDCALMESERLIGRKARVGWADGEERERSPAAGDESMSPRRSPRSPRKPPVPRLSRRSASRSELPKANADACLAAYLAAVASCASPALVEKSAESHLPALNVPGMKSRKGEGRDEEGAESWATRSTTSMALASEFSTDSVDTVLSRSMGAVRALQSVADSTPSASRLRPALDAVVKEKLDVAWAAMCVKLDLELDTTSPSRRGAVGTPLSKAGSPRKSRRSLRGFGAMSPKTGKGSGARSSTDGMSPSGAGMSPGAASTPPAAADAPQSMEQSRLMGNYSKDAARDIFGFSEQDVQMWAAGHSVSRLGTQTSIGATSLSSYVCVKEDGIRTDPNSLAPTAPPTEAAGSANTAGWPSTTGSAFCGSGLLSSSIGSAIPLIRLGAAGAGSAIATASTTLTAAPDTPQVIAKPAQQSPVSADAQPFGSSRVNAGGVQVAPASSPRGPVSPQVVVVRRVGGVAASGAPPPQMRRQFVVMPTSATVGATYAGQMQPSSLGAAPPMLTQQTPSPVQIEQTRPSTRMTIHL
mmetsp:Transcript_3961/g.11034  ORF Transcript_3961/g.11034 Transcript_3961/m.11034 type:complete len:677 (-) Transcript_3961:504-2534(-)